jgi:hypothetical protein
MRNHFSTTMKRLFTFVSFLEATPLFCWILLNAVINSDSDSYRVAAFQSILPKKFHSNHRSCILCNRNLPRRISRESRLSRRSAATAIDSSFEYALLFDCDGVILETEELHRLAYNEAFRHFHLTVDNEPVVWSVRTASCTLFR